MESWKAATTIDDRGAPGGAACFHFSQSIGRGTYYVLRKYASDNSSNFIIVHHGDTEALRNDFRRKSYRADNWGSDRSSSALRK